MVGSVADKSESAVDPLREVARRWISSVRRALAEVDERTTNKSSPVRQNARPIKVIVMTFSRRDHQALEKMAERHNWQLVFAHRWTAILPLAHDHDTGLVLLDQAVLGSDWKEAIWLLVQPPHRCCVILICSRISRHFCEQFVEMGGCKVLKTPLQETEVVDTIGSAWASWKHS